MKVSLSHMSDMCAFKFVTLHNNGVEDVEPRRAPPKGKVVGTYGNLGVCLLLNMSSVIGR